MASSTNRPPSPYTSPRAPPAVPTHSRAQTLVIRKIGSESSIIPTRKRPRDYELQYDYFDFLYKIPVRQGHVSVQCDTLRSWSRTRRLWLVLDSTRLKFCSKKDSEPSETIKLQQIRQVERVDAKPYCLMVAAASRTWYLLFEESAPLYDWFYDLRIRCPLLQIGLPTDFRHEMHVAYDRNAQEITGLPEAWIAKLTSWGVAPHFKSTQTLTRSPGHATGESESLDVPPTPPPKDSRVHEFIPNGMQERRPNSRFRSASDATPNLRAPSTVTTLDQFRRSPHRYREVEARDLTGTVRTVHLLPASRHDNCDVWRGEWTGAFGTRKVAIQIIRLFNPISRADQERLSSIVLEEVKALHQLRHPNVVRTRGFCKDHGYLPALISTWLPGGNIIDYIREKRPVVEKSAKIRLLTQVAAGLTYLHDFTRQTVHGELRGANVLITDNGSACITGYGLNPVMQELAGDPDNPSPFCLSSRWAAIEVILLGRRQISKSSDVFSFARTVLEVMTGKDPYHYISDDAEVSSAVVRGVPPRRPPIFGDDGLWHFLERCWMDVPTQRPSMAVALVRMEDTLSLYDNQPIEERRNMPISSPRRDMVALRSSG